MRVLVVEDARRLADAIARGLRAEGMAVDVAYDGLEGHQKATFTRYDVVVLDRDLPEMHGDDLLAEIVSAAGDLTRVLMLTASAGGRRPGGRAVPGRRRLPVQAVRLPRTGRPGAGPGPSGHTRGAAGASVG